MKVIKAPKPIPPSDEPHVFLAGSIEQDTAEDWQHRFARAMDGFDCVLLNPRRDEWDSTWTEDSPMFQKQVTWELNALDLSDVIVMYFDPATKSPITLLELGLYAKSGKLIVCCPEGFWRRGNVRIVCERHGVPMYPTLEDLAVAAKSRVSAMKMLRLIRSKR